MKKNITKGKDTVKKSKICIRLCLCKVVDDLHIDFTITEGSKGYGSNVFIRLGDKVIADYNLKGAEPVLQKILNDIESKKTILACINPKE